MQCEKERKKSDAQTENDMINHSAPAIIVFTYPNERMKKHQFVFVNAHHSARICIWSLNA